MRQKKREAVAEIVVRIPFVPPRSAIKILFRRHEQRNVYRRVLWSCAKDNAGCISKSAHAWELPGKVGIGNYEIPCVADCIGRRTRIRPARSFSSRRKPGGKHDSVRKTLENTALPICVNPIEAGKSPDAASVAAAADQIGGACRFHDDAGAKQGVGDFPRRERCFRHSIRRARRELGRARRKEQRR